MKDPLLITLFLSFIIHLTTPSSEYPIGLSVSQHRKYFPYESSTFTQYVNVEIETGDNKDQRSNVAQELFLILDTSGSMGWGEKLTNAKLAIKGIIENINENDRLHLIEYNSHSSIVFEDQHDRELMLNRLNALHSSGGTNLMSGFDQTRLLLKKYSERKSLKRIFVFSDGQINEGVTDHQQLLHEVTSMKSTYGLTICSFGIGTDFDEKLMTNLADSGSGDYFFIRGADSMKKVLDIAFKGFQALIGTNAYLKITTKNDASIRDAHGYKKSKDHESEIIPIGDIRYNDHMNVLLETEIKITEKFLQQSQIDYMIIELWMIDVKDQRSKLVSTESIVFSLSKNDEELKDLNRLVDHLVQLQDIQKHEEKVTELLKQRRTQEASQLKQDLTNRLKSMSTSLDDFQPNDHLEERTKMYIKEKSDTMHRRSAFMTNLFVEEGISDEELTLHSSFSSSSNARYKKSHRDL